MGSITKNQDEKELQQQLVVAYQKELAQTRTDSKKEKIKEKNAQPLTSVDDPLYNKINQTLDAFHSQMQGVLATFEKSFDDQYLQWREIHALVDEEKKVLSDAYGISAPPESITAIVKLRQERKLQAENELIEMKSQIQEEIQNKRVEFQIKETAFAEKMKKREAEFEARCDELIAQISQERQYVDTAEKELKQKREQQEQIWISRSEELEQAYQVRMDELEVQLQQRRQALIEEYALREEELEKEWDERQRVWEDEIQAQQNTLKKLQEQIQEKGDELSRVNHSFKDLVSRKTSYDPSARRQPLATGGNRIVRPMKPSRGTL
jgi:hypothetical protein